MRHCAQTSIVNLVMEAMRKRFSACFLANLWSLHLGHPKEGKKSGRSARMRTSSRGPNPSRSRAGSIPSAYFGRPQTRLKHNTTADLTTIELLHQIMHHYWTNLHISVNAMSRVVKTTHVFISGTIYIMGFSLISE